MTTTSTALATSATPYIVEVKATNLDGSTSDVTTYDNPTNLSVIERQTTVITSFDGRTVSTRTQGDFDGTHYNVVHDTVVKNADGTTTETRNGTGSFGATLETAGSQIIVYEPGVDYREADRARRKKPALALKELAHAG